MAFDEKTTRELQGQLDPEHIYQRKGAGGKPLDYVKGWHVIAEANRIFGFGGWNCKTLDLECVWEGVRLVGKEKNERPACTYRATVLVEVAGVTREGTGAGHDADYDMGLAHENAAKEAETDAFKRAMRTFGDLFGLALYDPERRGVADPNKRDETLPMTDEERQKLEAGIRDKCGLGEVYKFTIPEGATVGEGVKLWGVAVECAGKDDPAGEFLNEFDAWQKGRAA